MRRGSARSGHGRSLARRARRGVACGAGVLAIGVMGGCDGREKQTIGEVQRSFAEAAVAGGASSGGLGTIRASGASDGWSRLTGVDVRMGDAFWLRAESAEIIVDPETDTMRLRFNRVLWVAPESPGGGPSVLGSLTGGDTVDQDDQSTSGDGVIRTEATLLTDPWPLAVDVVHGVASTAGAPAPSRRAAKPDAETSRDAEQDQEDLVRVDLD